MSGLTLNRDIYLQLQRDRKTLSQHLEEVAPSQTPGLDAFQEQLKANGLITKTLSEKGIWASTVEAFYRSDNGQVLFPEHIARTVREANVQDTVLPYLVGQHTVIEGNSYRTYYVEDSADNRKASQSKRVTEASELPKSKIVGKENNVKIYKFGRQIEASYEVVRRMQIDMLALHVRRIAMQTAKDKVQEILTVVENGDGNNNAAPVHKLTDLDAAAVAGTLTSKGLLSFLMLFEEFPVNTLVGSKDAFLQLVLANLGSYTATDVLNLLSKGGTAGVRLTSPQLPNQSINLFWNSNVTGTKLIGMNSQYAIEEVTEAGSDISEADKFITRQVQVLTVSENSGYSKMFNEATKVLNIGA